MKKNKLVAPVLKWVGGKRQLIETFSPLLPKKITSYCEPFVGGGALLFHLQPNIAYVNDINTDLLCVYTVIKDSVDELIEELKQYKNDSDFIKNTKVYVCDICGFIYVGDEKPEICPVCKVPSFKLLEVERGV